MKFLNAFILLSIMILSSCQSNKKSDSINNINNEEDAFNASNKNTDNNEDAYECNCFKVYDNIYFGKTNPYTKSTEDYMKFLYNYETEISGVKFYYWQGFQRYIYNENGLYNFGLATIEDFNINDTKKIIEELKSIIGIKYPNVEKHQFSDKESMEKIDSIMVKNLEKLNPSSSNLRLKTNYTTYEYTWEKDNIRVRCGYYTKFVWVDKNGKILLMDGNDITSKIQGQKKVYKPIIEFTNIKIIDSVWSSFEKNQIEYKKKSFEKDANKF